MPMRLKTCYFKRSRVQYWEIRWRGPQNPLISKDGTGRNLCRKPDVKRNRTTDKGIHQAPVAFLK